MEVSAQPFLSNHKRTASITGTLTDISERKRAEAEIQKLAAFPRFSPNPVMELSADGTLTYLNNAADEIARLLKMNHPESILPPNATVIAQECLHQGQSKLSQEIQINGRTLSWSFFPIIGSRVVHCYGADITERVSRETQLRHAQKLECIGQLAAGVAHDFNNILTLIQGHTDRLVAKCEGDPALAEPLCQVSTASRRAASLTQQLLMFSRKQRMQPKVLDLNTVIANMAGMLQRLLGEDIKLEANCTATLPATEADAGMIEQIIMNLSLNARDAMPKGGRLVIATEPVTIDTAYVQRQPEAQTGRFVCLSVTDTGTGMSKETLGRVFEPFFTTKEVGKGTGLGLATVYGIVKQHQGWVEVRSELGIGTTFRIYLHACASTVEAPPDKALPAPALQGNETILLVEDEPWLRELTSIVLKDYKYEVLEASSGVEALKVFERHQGQVDLLLTDLVMPEGMTGRELAQQLKNRKPELKVIYTSGYSPDVMGSDIGLPGSKFLPKPYPPPLLAKTIRECFDRAA
jgi:signal transduction histidine kinase/CheY-like chemotaxis protein